MTTDQRQVDGGVLTVAWILAVLTVGYMLPWAVAATRGRANHGSIALINVLLGWSLIGWIVALVMACQAHQVVGPQTTATVVLAQQFPQAGTTAPPTTQWSVGPGWYPSPDGVGRQYWDGSHWTGHRAP